MIIRTLKETSSWNYEIDLRVKTVPAGTVIEMRDEDTAKRLIKAGWAEEVNDAVIINYRE